jgi:hypothetical protein
MVGIHILAVQHILLIRTALVFFRSHVSDEAPALIKNVEQTLEKVNGLLQDFSNVHLDSC